MWSGGHGGGAVFYPPEHPEGQMDGWMNGWMHG